MGVANERKEQEESSDIREQRDGCQGEREMKNMGEEEYLWMGPGKWGGGGTGAPEALLQTWVGFLLPAPALGCTEATPKAAVRTRTGCKGLIPTEEANMDAAGGALDHRMSWCPPGRVSGL